MSMPPPFDGARPEYPSHAGREAGGSNPFGGVSPTPPGPGGVTGQPPSPTGSWDHRRPARIRPDPCKVITGNPLRMVPATRIGIAGRSRRSLPWLQPLHAVAASASGP